MGALGDFYRSVVTGRRASDKGSCGVKYSPSPFDFEDWVGRFTPLDLQSSDLGSVTSPIPHIPRVLPRELRR